MSMMPKSAKQFYARDKGRLSRKSVKRVSDNIVHWKKGQG